MTLPTSNISILDLKTEAGGGGATSVVTQVYTGNGSYTVPAGITTVAITAIAAGGGGGGTQLVGNSHPGGAGGPGGVQSTVVSVTPGETLTVEVGAAGTPASNVGTFSCAGNGTINGGDGGQSRVYRASAPGSPLAIASGGFGGNGAVGDADAPTDGNHTNGGSGNSGTPTVVSNPQFPSKSRDSYFYTEGAGNNTGYGAGGDGVGLFVENRCATPGTQGAVMIAYSSSGVAGSGNSLGDYYAGGGIVPNPPPTSAFQTAPIPTSGPIELGSFLGVTLTGIEDQVDQSTANSLAATGYNVASRATSLGWNGTASLSMKITIASGVVLTNSSGGFAFTLGSLPAGSTIVLINNGIIVGQGGAGGAGSTVSASGEGIGTGTNGGNGGSGGNGMSISYPISITNNGIIAGGGGGGGGGASAYAYYSDIVNPGQTIGAGFGGGGGGGGNGGVCAGGAGGTASISGADTVLIVNGLVGTSGTGSRPGFRATNGNATVDNNGTAGWGGIGGSYGQPGAPGTSAWLQGSFDPIATGTPGAAGPGGSSLSGGGNITWMNYGSVIGNVDSWGTWGGGNSNFIGLMASITSSLETYMAVTWTIAAGDRWYWNVQNAGQINVPATTFTTYMVYSNTSGSNITGHVYGAVDNLMTALSVNGAGISIGTFPGAAFASTYQTGDFTLVPGVNVIAVTVQNTASSVAGFNFRIRRTSDNLVLAGPNGWFI